MKLHNISVVLICGGKSLRMGSLTKFKPKTLLEINNKPILWYTILKLYQNGFRNFFFTLGYKGDKIKKYVQKTLLTLPNANFYFIKTGLNSNISKRIFLTLNHNKLSEDLLLLNSDTIFKFNMKNIFSNHISSKKYATLIAMKIISKFGLIVKNKKNIIKFTRNQYVDNFSNLSLKNNYGYIYSGIFFSKKQSLLKFNLKKSKDFEIDFFNYLIKKNNLQLYYTNNFCVTADTPKDVEELNKNKVLKKMKNNLLKYKNN